MRQVQAQTIDSTVPLASDRAGNFAGSGSIIYDPATRVLSADGAKVISQTGFPGNVIPASRISPVSQALLQYYPLPNNNVRGYANNFLGNENATSNADAETARVDWQATNTQSLVFRYSHGNEPQYGPAAIPQQGGLNSTVTHQALLGHTWVLGPNKVNEFKLGFSRLELVNSNLRTAQKITSSSSLEYPM